MRVKKEVVFVCEGKRRCDVRVCEGRGREGEIVLVSVRGREDGVCVCKGRGGGV